MAKKTLKRAKRRTVSPSVAKSRRRQKATKRPPQIQSDLALETALKYLREGRSQRRAAEIGMVSVKRFRGFLRRNKLARYKNGHWRITDRRQREIAIISDGEERQIKVRGFGPASSAMRHREAVRQFLESNDAGLLVPFQGQTVTDTSKQKHLLETRPNVLYRLANTGGDADMKIYRLI